MSTPRWDLCRLFAALLALSLAPLAAAQEQDPRWTVPATPPTAYLPKLAQPLALDGDLAEWAGAVAVPVRFADWIAHRNPAAAWNGPADVGMEVYCAWSEAGLCLAARVTDNDVINERDPGNLWQQDCLELFFDGRQGEALLSSRPGPGFYQVLVAPRLDGDVVVKVMQALPEGVNVSAAGRRTPDGYRLEVLVPWPLFAGLTPKAGAQVGMQFAVDDYDARHGTISQPLMLSWRGAQGLFMSPHKQIRWLLCDTVPKAADTPLDAAVALVAPKMHSEGDEVPVRVEVPGAFKAAVGKASLEVADWSGKRVWQQDLKFAAAPAPWTDAVVAGARWPAAAAPDGA